MTSCIITVMKNEHEYLDEWIKYHLDLGINHIFIFEDIDSKTHKSITDKYGDKVSLNSVFKAFEGEKPKEEIIELKKTSNCYQISYFIYGIKWIKKNYPNLYDWCFAIDNDEFIALEKETSTLDDILKIYEGYDAFMLQWKCYGANGLIYKPNYEGKGLVGTYTKVAKVQEKDSGIWCTKTCYNLNTFESSFFWSVHQPSDKCKWCKSNKMPYRMLPIYDNIYIKHYITKSWEEYVIKVKIRGDISQGNRKYDDFFDINTDLSSRKEELLKLTDDIISKQISMNKE